MSARAGPWARTSSSTRTLSGASSDWRASAPATRWCQSVPAWADAEIVGRVGPSVFLPQPRVESALLRITRRAEPATTADPDALFALVRAGFGHRRKMLRRSLAGLVDAAAFARADIAPEAR